MQSGLDRISEYREPSMSKVAIFRQNLFLASETFIREQARALQRHEPVYVCRRPASNIPEGVRVQNLYTAQERAKDLFFGLTGRSVKLRDAIRDVDLVHAHFGPDGLYASVAAQEESKPLVVTFHGRDVTVTRIDLLRKMRPVSARYALQRRALGDRATVMLCVSNEIRKNALSLGLPENKLRVHYIGVDTVRYAEYSGPRVSRIIHVARLTEKKGTADLISAFSRISTEFVDTNLLIVGDGPLRGDLEKQVYELNLQHRVQFCGMLPADEVRKLVASSAVFALPSVTAANGDKEGLPIALLEAMSLGTPVVSTRHSGIPEAVVDNSVGILSAEHDVLALSNSLREFLTDPHAAREIGANAAELVRQRFNIAKQTALLEEIYDSVR